ncbi:hypothetical protein [Escherichia coli]|uniref:hypothetical protein n=1 Tax=Escherichia coli TaxID=562 RepID=UPI00388D4CBC
MRMPSAKAGCVGLFLHRYRQNDLHRGRRDKDYGNTLKDSYENLVEGATRRYQPGYPAAKYKAESIAWNEDQRIYTATYTALLPGTGLKAQLQMSGWATL